MYKCYACGKESKHPGEQCPFCKFPVISTMRGDKVEEEKIRQFAEEYRKANPQYFGEEQPQKDDHDPGASSDQVSEDAAGSESLNYQELKEQYDQLLLHDQKTRKRRKGIAIFLLIFLLAVGGCFAFEYFTGKGIIPGISSIVKSIKRNTGKGTSEATSPASGNTNTDIPSDLEGDANTEEAENTDEDTLKVPEKHYYSGYTYTILEDDTAEITDFYGSDSSLVIPEELESHPVSSIGENAFYSDDYTSITIPDTVTKIGNYAFEYCNELTSLTIPDNVVYIGDYAFSYCSSLTTINIPNSVSHIGANPFLGCKKLTEISISPRQPAFALMDGVLFQKNEKSLVYYPISSENTEYVIPDGIKTIGDQAFSGCENLTSVSIPDSVVSVGDNPFIGCTQLEKLTVSSNNTGLYVQNGVLFSKDDNRLICFPCTLDTAEYEIPEGIKIIGYGAFYDCRTLMDIRIPDTVEMINDYAFANCSSISTIIIPESVNKFGDYVFLYCSKMTSVVLPESLTDIGNGTFSWCRSLTDIKIPDSVTSIGYNTFSNCYSLSEIVIPDGVTEIGGSAFWDCDGLTAIIIPESVTEIGGSAFYDCDGLTSVNIPDNVIQILGWAFEDCDNLEEVFIPASVTFMGPGVFDDCNNLTVTVAEDSYAQQYCEDNDIPYQTDWLQH